MKTLIFSEHNSWEHETWNFFVSISDENETKLRKLIDNTYGRSYSLSPRAYTEAEMNLIIESNKNSSGYMLPYTNCGELIELPDSIDWENSDPFYKGGIEKMCKVVNQ